MPQQDAWCMWLPDAIPETAMLQQHGDDGRHQLCCLRGRRTAILVQVPVLYLHLWRRCILLADVLQDVRHPARHACEVHHALLRTPVHPETVNDILPTLPHLQAHVIKYLSRWTMDAALAS
jgi:hypothetical protein